MEIQAKGNRTLLLIIIGILALLLVAQLFQILTTFQQDKLAAARAADYQSRVDAAQELVDQQQDPILDLVRDYNEAAYNNPDLDRISEQQLIAEEFQIVGLQILAIQNSQIIELLSAAP